MVGLNNFLIILHLPTSSAGRGAPFPTTGLGQCRRFQNIRDRVLDTLPSWMEGRDGVVVLKRGKEGGGSYRDRAWEDWRRSPGYFRKSHLSLSYLDILSAWAVIESRDSEGVYGVYGFTYVGNTLRRWVG